MTALVPVLIGVQSARRSRRGTRSQLPSGDNRPRRPLPGGHGDVGNTLLGASVSAFEEVMDASGPEVDALLVPGRSERRGDYP